MNKVFKYLFLIVSLPIILFSDSVTLYNDTPFELTAVVEAADGTLLGQQTIQPGTQETWNSNVPTNLKLPQTSSSSLTPYRIIWKCKGGDYFSYNSYVAPGAVVQASLGEGQHYCRSQKKEKKKKLVCPPCPPCPAAKQKKTQ